MTEPVPAEFQLQFLDRLQRLLNEGAFVATYKFALLNAIADLAVTGGTDTGAGLELRTYDIAERFVELYWRQVRELRHGDVLRQNTGATAAVVRLVDEARREHGESLASARRGKGWRTLVKKVEKTVKAQPLWKLQTVGSGVDDFLYANTGRGTVVTLRPGVSFCFRKFRVLVVDLVRGAWVRHIRRHNASILGGDNELHAFLFGTERKSLKAPADVLLDLYGDDCFYCGGATRADSRCVDHVVPWSWYPMDLGQNFVLAHASCNGDKSDFLPSIGHLERWWERNTSDRDLLNEAFESRGVLSDAHASERIAHWACGRVFESNGMTWVKKKRVLEPLPRSWPTALSLL